MNEVDAIAEGLELCNKYRKGVGLPRLNRFFEEDRSPAQDKPPDTRRESDKERRSREYYERTKKWMDEQGMS